MIDELFPITLAATGHRPNKLGGYGQDVHAKLVHLAAQYLRYDIGEKNISFIITGMAQGWDQAWCEAALHIGIKVEAAVPFVGQERTWPIVSQDKYHDLLKRCMRVHIVSSRPYAPEKMQFRNEWMVQRAGKMVALWDGTEGGTANCIKYANKLGVEIDNLWSRWEQLK